MWINYNLAFLVVVIQHAVGYYIEYVTISACESCALRLTCRDFSSIIVIIEVFFEAAKNYTIREPAQTSDGLLTRMSLNRRCSGVNHCSFILTKDCPGAEKWGFGNLTIKYACVSEQRVTKYCNREITLPAFEAFGVSQGFVYNPGYPRFYVGRMECRWRIRAPSLQKVKITIFDLALVANPNRNTCSDVLRISDPAQLLFSVCKQEEPPAEILSLGDTLEITLVPSPTESLLPMRGVLFYYTAVGCPVPRAPSDSYLVYRNDTVAEFSCCFGFAFPDIQKSHRVIKCIGHQWDTPLPLPSCHNLTEIENSYSKEVQPSTINMVSKTTLEEIVIPSIIIVMLLIINSIILFIICRYKRRANLTLQKKN